MSTWEQPTPIAHGAFDRRADPSSEKDPCIRVATAASLDDVAEPVPSAASDPCRHAGRVARVSAAEV
jgi:hypothetical protein